ncbi:hypothetical protein D3C74_374140 [compost metagenome]
MIKQGGEHIGKMADRRRGQFLASRTQRIRPSRDLPKQGMFSPFQRGEVFRERLPSQEPVCLGFGQDAGGSGMGVHQIYAGIACRLRSLLNIKHHFGR